MKKLAELTKEDSERAYELGKEIMELFQAKNVEALVAVRAIEMVASTILHGAEEVEGRNMVGDFVFNVRRLYQDIT